MPRQTPAPAPRPVRDWITIEETASHLGLTKVAVRNMIREGRLKAYRNGPRIVRLDRNEVDAALVPFGGDV